MNPTTYVRMSTIGGCELQTAHRTIGTPESRRGPSNSMALKMGTALEPVINTDMEEHGAFIHFGTGFQLEFDCVSDDGRVIMMGHTDGLITFGPMPSTWLLHELPKSAIELLSAGGTMLWEVKTMNDETWTSFMKDGMRATPLLSKYYQQVQSYLGTLLRVKDQGLAVRMQTSEFDPKTGKFELHTYEFALGEWLIENSMEWPSSILLCAFNTATKKYGFRTISFDELTYTGLMERATRILDLLAANELPDPTYDGSSTECYWCGFAGLCPAIKRTMAAAIAGENELGIDAFSVSSPTELTYTMEELDEAMQLYVEANTALAEAARIKKVNREKIETGLRELNVGGLHSDKYRARYSEVKGRRTIDQDTLRVMLDQASILCPDCDGAGQVEHMMEGVGKTLGVCELCAGVGRIEGLSVPYRRGEAFHRLSIKSLYGPSYEEESS